MALAGRWWFWPLTAIAVACAGLLARSYPGLVLRVRRRALEKGLVRLGPGQRLASRPTRGDLSWLALPAAVWIAAGPWIWGYDDAPGAVGADIATAAAVLTVALAAIVFPALLSLELVAGLWLVLAPWLVGYGDNGGPVGLSDVSAGLVVCAAALTGLAAAERQAPSARGGGVGRLPRRGGPGP
jgi:hypothetical protein